MEFAKYHSIENKLKPLDGEYIGTEKIHGANFSFYCDGNVVRFAKRTSFIESEKEKGFYKLNEAKIIHAYKKNVMNLFHKMKEMKEYGNTKYIAVIGELFGGLNPSIQKGIYYCNEVEFMAFDLKVFTNNGDYFEGYDERAKLFDVIEKL